MKLLVFVFVAVAWAQANQVKPVTLNPPFVNPKKLESFFNSSPRIVGGEEVLANSLPYQVGLFIPNGDGQSFCGGSLISTTAVLTAAHCAELSNQITVVLGAHRILENEPTQVIRQSSQVIIHPGWNRLTLQNDIAIIRIQAVSLNANIQTVTLPSRADASNAFVGQQATSSGWGLDRDGATSISEVLRSITTPIGSNSLCNIYYLGVIQNSHICASGDGGKSTCSGDSGGPLVLQDGRQVGVVSFGIALGCEIGWPHVYTRVTEFLDWIQQNSDVTIN